MPIQERRPGLWISKLLENAIIFSPFKTLFRAKKSVAQYILELTGGKGERARDTQHQIVSVLHCMYVTSLRLSVKEYPVHTEQMEHSIVIQNLHHQQNTVSCKIPGFCLSWFKVIKIQQIIMQQKIKIWGQWMKASEMSSEIVKGCRVNLDFSEQQSTISHV